MRNDRFNILVVDDDPEEWEVLAEVFGHLGYAELVTFYPSGTDLLNEVDNLRSLSPLPRVIVLDYQMPCSTGLDVLKVLNGDLVLCKIPVVFYATGMSQNMKKKCLETGALMCFEKGDTFEEMLAFARYVLEAAHQTSTAE